MYTNHVYCSTEPAALQRCQREFLKIMNDMCHEIMLPWNENSLSTSLKKVGKQNRHSGSLKTV